MKKTIIALVLACAVTFSAEKHKVIFDCDLGGDIDDAFAVALLLASPEFDILGLVMDHGDTPGRAKIACRMLYECGLEHIPVVVGRHTPGIVGEQTALAGPSHQFVWASNFDKVKPIKQNAVDFISEQLNTYPGEVILFTVGPVPNISDILDKNPDVLKKAKRIVSMFGSFYMGYGGEGTDSVAEWNVRGDIKSAQKYINAGLNPLLAGLDVTTFVKLEEDYRMRLLYRNSPLTDAICGLYTLWRYESYAYPDPTMFDGVAIGMVLWPELFTTKKVHTFVDDKGFTRIDETKEPNCEIGVSVNKEEFLSRMVERLLKQNFMRQD